MKVGPAGPAGPDDGAMAVACAFLVVLLLMVAALAVELTDVYSRDRAVQTRADLAALAGAQALPDPCAAVEAARRNLEATANRVASSTPPPTSSTAYSDGDLDDGEIQVLTELVPPPPPLGSGPASAASSSGAWLSTSGCAGGDVVGLPGGRARYVRVVTPEATREYALARTFSLVDADASRKRVSVQRAATAGISSPSGPGARVLPFLLPAGCGDGTKVVLTGPRPVSGGVEFRPAGEPRGPEVSLRESVAGLPGSPFFDPGTVDGAIVVTVDVDGLAVDPRTEPQGLVVLDFHTTDGTATVRQPTAPEVGAVGRGAREVETRPGGQFRATVDVTVPEGVEAVPGRWRVRAAQPNAAGGPAWTPDDDAGELTIEGRVADGGSCDGAVSGDFGLVDAGRCAGAPATREPGCAPAPGDQLQENIALGLDHALTTFRADALPAPTAATPTRCGPTTPAGAVLDSTRGGVEGANCISVGSGNVAGQVTNGLVSGPSGSTTPGRLARSTAMPVPGTAPASCRNPAGRDDFLWETPVPGGPTVVNTVLSCYLAPGRTLADVLTGRPGSLVTEVYQDPRFFFVPVLNGLQRPPSSDDHYAVRELKGAFVTDEGLAGDGSFRAARPCAAGASGCNGVQFANTRGGRQVFAVTAFVFPASALPESISQPGNGDRYLAGTKDVVLVE